MGNTNTQMETRETVEENLCIAQKEVRTTHDAIYIAIVAHETAVNRLADISSELRKIDLIEKLSTSPRQAVKRPIGDVSSPPGNFLSKYCQ